MRFSVVDAFEQFPYRPRLIARRFEDTVQTELLLLQRMQIRGLIGYHRSFFFGPGLCTGTISFTVSVDTMSIRLSDRVQSIKPSPTLAVTARAAAMRAAGKDIIGLGAGEPDFDTPDHIKQAAIKAIQDGFTKYTAVDGTPGLKKAIVAKFARENGFDYTPAEILVSCGGKQSFYNLAQALLNPGDEVIIPAPYWVSYPDMVLLASATPVIVSAPQQQSFKISAEQLENAITAKTRLFVINSPSNPTGIAYAADELQALAAVLLRHPDVLIATDDMYEHILWSGDSFCNILNVCPTLKDRTIVLNGVSKAYSMTGWRIGYAAGPADVINGMDKIQSHTTSNAASISQKAAIEALAGPRPDHNGKAIPAARFFLDF